jgi:GTP cyclohydrolase II
MAMPDPLIEVDRAISEIRRGAVIRIYDERNSLLMMAVDALSADCLNRLTQSGSTAPKLVMTGTRMNVLGIDKSDRPVSVLSHPQGISLDLIEYLANPLSASMTPPIMANLEVKDADALEQSCVTLAKLARLLPAALIVEGQRHCRYSCGKGKLDPIVYDDCSTFFNAGERGTRALGKC